MAEVGLVGTSRRDYLALLAFGELSANVLKRHAGVLPALRRLKEKVHGACGKRVSLFLVVLPNLLIELARVRQALALAHGVERLDVAEL